MFVVISRLNIAALRSPAGKGLTSWLLFVIFNCVFITFPCGILGHLWYLFVLIPDLCRLSYFKCICCIKDILVSVGLSDPFRTDSVNSPKSIKLDISRILSDLYAEEWDVKANVYSKGKQYI